MKFFGLTVAKRPKHTEGIQPNCWNKVMVKVMVKGLVSGKVIWKGKDNEKETIEKEKRRLHARPAASSSSSSPLSAANLARDSWKHEIEQYEADKPPSTRRRAALVWLQTFSAVENATSWELESDSPPGSLVKNLSLSFPHPQNPLDFSRDSKDREDQLLAKRPRKDPPGQSRFIDMKKPPSTVFLRAYFHMRWSHIRSRSSTTTRS